MRREKNWNWSVIRNDDGKYNIEQVHLAVLMDLRDELQEIKVGIQSLNRVFQCHNALRIPSILDKIAANTNRKKRKKKAASHA